MKKIILATAIIMQSAQMFAATDNISTVIAWDVSARKDTQSALAVTPIKPLIFNSEEGRNVFNSDTRAFDISTAETDYPTDIKIVTTVLKNQLTRESDHSILGVGVALRSGEKLLKDKPVVFQDSVKNSKGSAEEGNFVFTIDSVTSDGVNKTALKNLEDGNWQGDVAIKFTTYWTQP